MIEGLGDFPRKAFGQCGCLMITTGHVQSYGISKNMRGRLIFGNVVTARLQDNDKLALIVKIGCEYGIRDFTSVAHNCIVRFHKDHWGVTLVLFHLPNVIEIILPNAVNATDGKLLV